eukprot:TRINITY_DN88043_c0_g1_i1.p1 TRINITY_DN88043_c0_g1~~TRINITY_DN88043_c0_g1_i1.p1  ORF type:complete len:1157 (+),score=212.55 TRINITY_DN88043_c0_g1_i1:28-3471(+)
MAGDGGRTLVTLAVGGMTCGACSSTVERALGNSPGVSQATVSCLTNLAHVHFDASTTTVETLIETVEDVGFEAKLLEVQSKDGSRDKANGAPAAISVELKVEGMTCSACSGTVERLLQGLKGVQRATVSLVMNKAFVVCDPEQISAAQLKEEIEDIGFDAEVALVGKADLAPSAMSVELKVEGMTCSACSGTVERHLQGLKGVQRATVSLVLNKAYVVCDPKQISAADVQEAIEDVGFDADILVVGTKESMTGRAHLNIEIKPFDKDVSRGIWEAAASFDKRSKTISGILACQSSKEAQRRIIYNPHVVGARKLLDQFKAEFGPQLSVEWVSVSATDELLQGHLSELGRMQSALVRGAPVALLIFVLTIVCPSLGFSPLAWHVHNGADALMLVVLVLVVPVQFSVGHRFHKAAALALKRRAPNMDVLVSVSTNIAFFYSLFLLCFCLATPNTAASDDLASGAVHFSAMGPILITVVLLGKVLEARSKIAAMRAMTDLPSNQPNTAVLVSHQNESNIPLELIELGDILRIYPGAKIPVDGNVCSASTVHVDESLLTGESKPVARKEGDLVLGGSTCISGGCLMQVTKIGADTTLGQMQQLIQDAQSSKANIQRTADKVARVFVPSVIFLALVTFLVWMGLVFSDLVAVPRNSGHGHHAMHMSIDLPDTMAPVPDIVKVLFAMKFGMAVLMIACPCAMGLATPVAVMVATGVAAKRGCLIKSAAALETSAHLDAIVLDKTGTITEGKPAVGAAVCIADSFTLVAAAWEKLSGSNTRQRNKYRKCAMKFIGSDPPSSPDELEDCFWWLLGTLESASDHPLAKCIQTEVLSMAHLPSIVAPRDFEYLSGRGLRCRVEQLGGVEARVGNLSFFEESLQRISKGQTQPAGASELLDWTTSLQRAGHTVVLLHINGLPMGAVAMKDSIRPDAPWVIDHLTNRLGLDVWLCTGDNTATAQTIAAEVGIRNVVAEALPSAKSACVRQLQQEGSGEKRVAFVGDGINDSPALAQADVGIAIGVGAQIVVEAADVALVRSELSDCVTFLALSQATFRTIMLNFFWAFCFNFLCLPMAAGIFYPRIHIPPLAAGIGMAASSCLVVFSSLRLRHFRPPVAPSAGSAMSSRRSRCCCPSRSEWRTLSDEGDLEAVAIGRPS